MKMIIVHGCERKDVRPSLSNMSSFPRQQVSRRIYQESDQPPFREVVSGSELTHKGTRLERLPTSNDRQCCTTA